MGEDGTENLSELEDSWARTQAEMDAVEAGGTGYYNDALYDPNLTDLDENKSNQSYDDSADFANFGNEEDDYSMTGSNEEEDGGQNDGEDDEEMPQGLAVQDETFEDDYDDDDDDDGDSDDDDYDEDYAKGDDVDEEDEGDIGGTVSYPDWGAASKDRSRFMDGTIVHVADGVRGQPTTFRAYREPSGAVNFQQVSADAQPTGKAAEKKEDDKYNGAIKWKPGQPITFKLLDQVWGKCRQIQKVRPMVDALNQAVDSVLNTTGPNLMLKLNGYISKTADSDMDTIGCLLKLAKEPGRRTAYTAFSVIEALFDQQWLQPTLIAGMNEATLQSVLTIPQVRTMANIIFTIAVPMINTMERIEKKKDKKS